MNWRIKIFFLAFGFFLSGQYSFAQDLLGGEIIVKHISGKTYSVNVVFYYNTLFTPRSLIRLNWGDKIDTLYYLGTTSSCGNPTVAAVKYVGNHTYNSYGNYNISCIDSFRVANIKNITNSSAEKLSLQLQISVSAFWGGNNSVSSTQCPVDNWQCCVWGYNPSSYDLDGDSLSYSLVPPFTTNYTFPPASVNGMTGTMTFTPTVTGLYSFCMRIDEWRGGGTNKYLIGSTFREMIIDVTSLVGIKEYNNSNPLKIFPNPVSNILNIMAEQNEFENSEIEIMNTLGQTVLKLNFKNEIDVSKLSQGFYSLKISTQSKQIYYSSLLKE